MLRDEACDRRSWRIFSQKAGTISGDGEATARGMRDRTAWTTGDGKRAQHTSKIVFAIWDWWTRKTAICDLGIVACARLRIDLCAISAVTRQQGLHRGQKQTWSKCHHILRPPIASLVKKKTQKCENSMKINKNRRRFNDEPAIASAETPSPETIRTCTKEQGAKARPTMCRYTCDNSQKQKSACKLASRKQQRTATETSGNLMWCLEFCKNSSKSGPAPSYSTRATRAR